MEERAALLREAKRLAIIKELRDLRLSDPSVPLVSELDLDQLNDNPLMEMDEAGVVSPRAGLSCRQVCGWCTAEVAGSYSQSPVCHRVMTPGGLGYDPMPIVHHVEVGLVLHYWWERLEARLTSLERSHALLLKKWRSLQAAPAPVAPTSAQKGEHVGKLQNADFLYESLIEDYRLFRLRARTRPKDLDNAKQSASHSLRFCRYMAQGVAADCLTRSVRFLNRLDHLRG
uniref:Uncharacterized protein n=1 Tax=Knipowitschia caucasica TaxID=637954 RepID=A0AAV2M2N4_KNICA